ncbi:MAG TPA: hypothetical protein VMH04_19260 [Candidatus Solibacter sp.]|nr:hypothetical protein [Candidatus Solibacter sp.]
MRRLPVLLLAVLFLVGCNKPVSDLSPANRANIETQVRGFLAEVSRDVTSEGPSAWQKEFADDPAFFMAADGFLAFPNRQAATRGIQQLPNVIKKIELRWGDDLRVDVLAPNLAMVAASYRELQTDPQGHQKADNGFFTAIAEFTRHAGRPLAVPQRALVERASCDTCHNPLSASIRRNEAD